MATEKWIAGSGQGLTWGTLASTVLNALASANSVLGNNSVTNGTALDLFADFSIALPAAAFASPNFIGLYLYPLGDDGTSYGDGRFATAASGVPGSNYAAGSISVTTSSGAQTGTLTRVVMPPGTWKPVIYNGCGVTLASSGNTLFYRTYNRSVA